MKTYMVFCKLNEKNIGKYDADRGLDAIEMALLDAINSVKPVYNPNETTDTTYMVRKSLVAIESTN